MYHGDIRLGDTIDIKFTTVDTSGVPTTLAGTPVISAYVGNGTTEITAGITLTVDFDARTGLHNVRVVASSGNGFATATNIQLVITTGTVGGSSVVGYVIGSFSIEARSALMPTTATRTLDVSATGEADANVTQWLGTAAATPTVAGVPEVDVTHFNGVAGTFASGRPEVNTSHVSGTLQTAGDIIGDTNDIQARLPAVLVSGRMDSSVGAYASGMTPTRPSASGTADSGSTTTVVDTERTEADVDYWKDCIIKFTSGTLTGQSRLITAFDPATDTLTFAPALTVAAGTHTYEIYAFSRVDLHFVLGVLINALISGRVDASVGEYQTGLTPLQPTVAGRTLDVTATGEAGMDLDNTTGTLGAAEIPTLDAAVSTRATPAQVSTEVENSLNVTTRTLPGQTAPPLAPTLVQAQTWLYKTLRNRKTQTATLWSLLADDELTVDAKATVSDDGTTAIKQEMVSGP